MAEQRKVKVKFITSVVVDDVHKGTAAETAFKKGKVYLLDPRSADHWQRRGKAEVTGNSRLAAKA